MLQVDRGRTPLGRCLSIKFGVATGLVSAKSCTLRWRGFAILLVFGDVERRIVSLTKYFSPGHL